MAMQNPTSATLPISGPKFSLLAELGRGGMATAYLAAIQGPGGFNKLVVVKRLRPALASEADFLRMFLEEARLSARIDHPNVVHTTEVGFDGEHHFIAMEFLDGQSLESIVRRLAKRQKEQAGEGDGDGEAAGELDMPLKFHLHIITQMLQGLDFAHELKDFDGNALNVVHRDVSPHNVMVTYEGHVKLLDFGIAKAADSSGDTRTGVMKGKCAYMPAEQFGGKQIDRRADVFAVGVILWQALAGRRLWKGLSDAEIFQRVATGNIPTPSSVREVPVELDEICMKALALRPADRFSSAAEFQAAIDSYVASHSELRTTSKELGKFVADLFTDKRAKLKSVIEAELGKVGQERSALIPVLGAPTSASGGSGGYSPSPAHSLTAPLPEMPRSKARLWALGALAMLAAAVIVVMLGRGAKETSTQAAATTSEASCNVTIRVTPPDAKIFLDDAPLDANPATTTLPRNAIKHKVRGEAPGYTTKSEWIAIEGARLTIDLTLDPEAHVQPSTAKSAKVDAKDAKKVPIWTPPPKNAHVAPPPSPAASTPPVVSVETKPVPPPPPPPSSKPTGPNLDKDDPWAPAKH